MTTRCSPRSSAAPNWARCRWSMPKTATSSRSLQQKLLAEGNNGPEAHAYSRPPEVEGEATNRAIMIADMAGHAALCRAHLLRAGARGDPPRAPEGHARLWRAADPASDAGRERIRQQGLGPRRAPRDEPALPQQDASGFALGRPAAGSLQVVATDHCAFTTEQKRYGVGDFTKIPNGTGGLEDRMPMLWTYGVRDRPADDERVRRRHLDQHRQDPQLYPKKGAILVGADADLVVWDPEKEKTITADTSSRRSTTTSSRASR
jgi:dihydropyrimidinase